MPYPHPFRPNTTCVVNDARGSSQTDCALQTFKPFLACQFNGPQSRIAGIDVIQFSSAILRGLFTVNPTPPLNIKIGPAYWPAALTPYLTLDEDPNAVKWYIVDAIPYDLDPTSGIKLYSFFAAVSYASTPAPPTPIVMSPSESTATATSLAVTYQSTLAPGASGWVYAPAPGGTATTWTMVSVSPGPAGQYQWQGASGSPSAPMPLWFQNPIASNIITTAAGSFPGPDAILGIQNTTGVPQTYVYSIHQ